MSNTNEILLDAVQKAYLKHHLGSSKIGWDELSNILLNALCNTMGEPKFIEWLNKVKGE